MNITNNLITPRNGEPLVAATQDFLTGSLHFNLYLTSPYLTTPYFINLASYVLGITQFT
jgi:DNA-directed RNA polymerase III subunit RPC1